MKSLNILKKNYSNAGAGNAQRVFFREKKSTLDLERIFIEGNKKKFSDPDFNDCKESCEAFV